jgi:hypothetical protein
MGAEYQQEILKCVGALDPFVNEWFQEQDVISDSACIVWGQTCGESGNCWLYDGQRLGFLLNFTASGESFPFVTAHHYRYKHSYTESCPASVTFMDCCCCYYYYYYYYYTHMNTHIPVD